MLRIDEQFVYNMIKKEGGMPEIQEAIELIKEYRTTDFYESKNTLLQSWEIDHEGLYELIISIFTIALENEELTIQAMVGMLNHKIKLKTELDRVKILADVIGLVSETGLIDIDSMPGEYHKVSTCYEFDEVIPREERHNTLLLRPQPVEGNWDKETGSVFCGHKMRHHEEFVRLSHLNRMNQIPYSLNKEFVTRYLEEPKELPYDEEGEMQWQLFQEESAKKYTELLEGTNKFHIRHCFDYRGRTNADSYYLNTQGSSYKKAAVQLFNKEIVKDYIC